MVPHVEIHVALVLENVWEHALGLVQVDVMDVVIHVQEVVELTVEVVLDLALVPVDYHVVMGVLVLVLDLVLDLV